jgi:hypothetical protein
MWRIVRVPSDLVRRLANAIDPTARTLAEGDLVIPSATGVIAAVRVGMKRGLSGENVGSRRNQLDQGGP